MLYAEGVQKDAKIAELASVVAARDETITAAQAERERLVRQAGELERKATVLEKEGEQLGRAEKQNLAGVRLRLIETQLDDRTPTGFFAG